MDRLKEYILCQCPLKTKNEFETGTMTVDVLCTWKEESDIFLNNSSMYYETLRPWLLDPEIFSTDVIKHLIKIDYLRYWEIKYNEFDQMQMTYADISMKVDELMLYLKSYGWTMKKKKGD